MTPGRPRWRVLASLVTLAALALTFAFGAHPVAAAEKVYDVPSVDVALSVNRDGSMRVVETYRYAFQEGSFHFVYRDLSLSRLDRVEDISVSEGGERYRAAAGGEEPGTYTVQADRSSVHIAWYFPTTDAPASRTFTLSYLVRGVVRVYGQYDEVFWKAVAKDHPIPVGSATVTLTLPDAPDPGSVQATTYGSPARWTVQGNQVVATTEGPIAAKHELEIRVSFPSDVVAAQVPSWQASYDQQARYDAHTRPTVDLALMIVTGLVFLVGFAGLMLLWYARGRDVRPLVLPPSYLPTPPSGLAPGLAAVLTTENVGNPAIIATLFDLARRGYVQIREMQPIGDSRKRARDTQELVRLQGEGPLAEYERLLLDAIFEEGATVPVKRLKNSLYKRLGPVRKAMLADLTGRGYFVENPEKTRTRFLLRIGLADLVGVVLLVPAILYAGRYSGWLLGVPIAVLGLTIVGFIVAVLMPRKTREGSTEAAGWRAYRRFLRQLSRRGGLEQAAGSFSEIFPYAVAFGLARQVVQRYSQTATPVPGWYVYWGAGVYHGASGGRSASLQEISDGFANMLNSVSGSLAAPGGSAGGSAGGGGGSGGGGFGAG